MERFYPYEPVPKCFRLGHPKLFCVQLPKDNTRLIKMVRERKVNKIFLLEFLANQPLEDYSLRRLPRDCYDIETRIWKRRNRNDGDTMACPPRHWQI